MKKSLQHFIDHLQKNGKDFTSGYITLKNLRGGYVADNGSCTNGDCSGTNKTNCTNTGDCSKATNSVTCSNTGGPGCCGS
jgi:hypothetical protein